MRSWRLLASALAINGTPVEASYADIFVVVRDGEIDPGPNDWEVTVRTADSQHLPPGTYELRIHTSDGLVLSGHALLRFSDGYQHLFRGDGRLDGVGAALA
ncbi:MAG: hypothetical protein ABWZ76_14655 [Acidimicrobiales bacterium]